MEWKGFDQTLPNCVYDVHDYSLMGFAVGDLSQGTSEPKGKLEKQFLWKCEFQHQQKVPIWNGEFEPTYADPRLDEDAEHMNQCRYALLEGQLSIYDKYAISRTTWLYKDTGTMDMV
jgi:hypothetical protein